MEGGPGSRTGRTRHGGRYWLVRNTWLNTSSISFLPSSFLPCLFPPRLLASLGFSSATVPSISCQPSRLLFQRFETVDNASGSLHWMNHRQRCRLPSKSNAHHSISRYYRHYIAWISQLKSDLNAITSLTKFIVIFLQVSWIFIREENKNALNIYRTMSNVQSAMEERKKKERIQGNISEWKRKRGKNYRLFSWLEAGFRLIMMIFGWTCFSGSTLNQPAQLGKKPRKTEKKMI